jgi:hypothetical protein
LKIIDGFGCALPARGSKLMSSGWCGTIQKKVTVMDVWRANSNQVKQTALSLLCVAAGLVMVISLRGHYTSSSMTNGMAGLMLGFLLLLIGICAFITSGKQAIVIDPHARLITIEDATRFGTKRRTIPFSEVVHVGIGYLGKKSNYVTYYYLVLKLRSGESYSLFAPGRFYDGASDRSVVEGWKQRLETYIGLA